MLVCAVFEPLSQGFKLDGVAAFVAARKVTVEERLRVLSIVLLLLYLGLLGFIRLGNGFIR